MLMISEFKGPKREFLSLFKDSLGCIISCYIIFQKPYVHVSASQMSIAFCVCVYSSILCVCSIIVIPDVCEHFHHPGNAKEVDKQ